MKYPLGIQTFANIREQNYAYVDKTALIKKLLNEGKAYFLSRPRRFGKSLLISTFESLFSGERSLFDGLAISQGDYAFAKHPVVLFEFSQVLVNKPDDLQQFIANSCNLLAQTYDIELTIDDYQQRFAELISKLQAKTGAGVVLLIDEYDKPILDNLFSEHLSEIKSVLNGFYGVCKSLDRHLHFTFITGVSKFAQVSVFSGMNNLTDISIDKRYASLCGITQQELESYFAESLNLLAIEEQLALPKLMNKVKYWYNGYRFHHKGESVYNPYSLLSLLSKQEFENFWFHTATPTFLIELIKKQQFDLSKLDDFKVNQFFFASDEPEKMTAGAVLLQAGYLTIADFDNGWYQLDFPNYEVKQAFNSAIVVEFAHVSKNELYYLNTLVESLHNKDVDGFIDTLKVFFANVPYDINVKHEKYYQSLIYAILTLLGLEVDVEVRTNIGRIDCTVATDDYVYIIEFKLDDNEDAAMAQIEDKSYWLKYQVSGKAMILLGVAFEQDARNIAGFKVKQLSATSPQ